MDDDDDDDSVYWVDTRVIAPPSSTEREIASTVWDDDGASNAAQTQLDRAARSGGSSARSDIRILLGAVWIRITRVGASEREGILKDQRRRRCIASGRGTGERWCIQRERRADREASDERHGHAMPCHAAYPGPICERRENSRQH